MILLIFIYRGLQRELQEWVLSLGIRRRIKTLYRANSSNVLLFSPERFGAYPGDPYMTMQIQHISITVMFCFAGLVGEIHNVSTCLDSIADCYEGMGIESRRIRDWLTSTTFASVASHLEEPDATAEHLSYSASFNPFPALVIGVTGAAMAAHAQTYLFQVKMPST